MPRIHPVFGVEKDHPKRSARFVLFAAVIVASSLLLIGCNTMPQSAAPSSTAAPVDLQISPIEPSVAPGGNVQFSATLSNTSKTAVIWSASAGTISSTGLFTAPANPSAGTVTITASSLAHSSTQAHTLVTIHKTNLAITASNLLPAVVGTPYSAMLTATGGQPPYQWSIVAGLLPTGLLLDANTGALSGSPTQAGTFDFSVRGTDAASQIAQQPLSLAVSTRPACGPPVYCSRTDVEVAPLPIKPPSVGNLSGANTIVIDPDFHNRIVRITDANTDTFPVFKNRSYESAASGSADENLWNLDSTLLIVQDTGAGGYPFTFNPTTMQAARMYVSSLPQTGGLRLPGGVWSRVNPNVLYTDKGTAINKYDFTDRQTPPSPQPVYDFTSSPNCLPPGFSVTWSTRGGVNSDDTVFGMGYSNTGYQNTGAYAVAYKVGSGCTVLNTTTGRVWGDWGARGTISRSERWTVHNTKISRDGNWLIIAVGTCMTAPRCYGPFFWQIGTTNVISCGDGRFCGGHWTEGYSHWVNNYNTPMFNQVIRLFGDKDSVNSLTNRFSFPFNKFFDQHQSWNNVDPNDSVPFTSSTWVPTDWFTAPWFNEIIAIAADGSGTTWRFAHSYITTRSRNFTTMYGIGSVSQDGRFFMFSSDWMGTLGSESGAKTCTIGTDCRGDVFVVELR